MLLSFGGRGGPHPANSFDLAQQSVTQLGASDGLDIAVPENKSSNHAMAARTTYRNMTS